MIKRFIEWYQYQASLSMLDITPKDEILLTIVNMVLLIGIPALAGFITECIERWWRK